ncbi:hypothetical protein [Virgibacillus ihumii]|uniref:hypothetical protein n=1 Tax=Virgibacillus ihumii TaxID=2686091 RepID=UPI00157C4F67|nr:hypothetical protein [Virgibacillus ihumii]
MKQEQIRRGVICPECDALPMIYANAKWNCTACGSTSKVAYLDALRELSLLFGEEVSNKHVREFLQLDNMNVVYRILKKAGFERLGVNKGTKYILKFE